MEGQREKAETSLRKERRAIGIRRARRVRKWKRATTLSGKMVRKIRTNKNMKLARTQRG